MIDIGPGILAAAKAIGLLDGGGNLSASWFENPLDGVASLLSSADQRAAVLTLLDQFFPPVTPLGMPANQKWHPLVANQPNGNLYLTTANGAGPLHLGIAGEIHSTTSLLPASLRCQLPIVAANGAAVTPIAGTGDRTAQMGIPLWRERV
jgi:hypothetical protein